MIKKLFGLAITVFVIADLSFGTCVSAKKLEIGAADVERIKTVLGMGQTMATAIDIIINNKDLTTVLNTIIRGGQTGVDVTYGLFVLSAFNEMELLDLVISQEYKIKQREYFKIILGERENLASYWKGISFDVQRIIAGQITGPMAALTLNTFEIVDKTFSIAVAFNILKTGQLYDGLWYYFDTRKQGGEPHEVAWSETKEILGFVVKNTGFLGSGKNRDDKSNQLEQQFFTLYEKWAPYVTPFGISKEYKSQVRDDLTNTLADAVQNRSFAEEKPKLSLVDKLYNQLEALKNAVASLVARVNPFKAGITLNLSEIKENSLASAGIAQEQENPLTPSPNAPLELPLTAPLETTVPLPPLNSTPLSDEPPQSENSLQVQPQEPEPLPQLESATTTEAKPKPAPSETIFCERGSANPVRFRVLINEIAWMGNQESGNNEWIELKNIWGIPINLNGWQLLDKDKQIKIIFTEKDVIPAQGFYILERTNDDSLTDIKANLIYTGALGNTDEALYLFNDRCGLEDEVLANPNWSAGDNALKIPMQRLDVLEWYTAQASPGNDNNLPRPAGSSNTSAAAALAPSSITYLQIIISETYTKSTGNQKDDFVELYNPNVTAIGLTGWYLQRKTADGENFSSYITSSLFEGKTIQANDYFLIANASSSFTASADIITQEPLTENNILALKNPEGEIADQVSTNDPLINKSYGHKWSTTTQTYANSFEDQNPTPRAQNQSTVVDETSLIVTINEVAWMGTVASAADEWIELYNNTTSTVDISNWKLISSDPDGTNITFSTSTAATTTIPAQGYYLIERTDDGAVSDIPADLTTTFGNGLSNTNCEVLYLYDENNNLQDETVCLGNNWPAGASSPNYLSMERVDGSLRGSDAANWAGNNRIPWDNWQGKDVDGNRINATPKSKNSVTKASTTIEVGDFIIDDDFTLGLLGSPYVVEGTIKVTSEGALRVESGVVLKFKHNNTWGSEFLVEGTLNAVGGNAEGEEVVFTSFRDDEYGGDSNEDASTTAAAAGDWDWLYLKNASSTLQNVVLRYGGKYHKSCCNEYPSFTKGVLRVEQGTIELRDSTVEKSYTRGLWLDNAAASVDNVDFANIGSEEYLELAESTAIYIEGQNTTSTIKNSSFQNNKIGVLIENNAAPLIENNAFDANEIAIKTSNLFGVFSSNTAQNNGLNGILVSNFGFSATTTQIDWQKSDLPFVLTGSNAVPPLNILNIKPGTIVKFKGNSQITIDGTLNIQGTQDDKMVFTSFNDDTYGGDTNNDSASTQPFAGYWNFILLSDLSADSIIDNAVIKYGGWHNTFLGGAGAKSGAIKINGATTTISNSSFENNLFSGLELENCTTTISNTTFIGNQSVYGNGTDYSSGILLRNATPVFTNTNFNKNYYGIYDEVGDCPDVSDTAKVIFGTEDSANTVNLRCSQ